MTAPAAGERPRTGAEEGAPHAVAAGAAPGGHAETGAAPPGHAETGAAAGGHAKGDAAAPPVKATGLARRCFSLAITAGLAAVAGLVFHRVFGWAAVVPPVAVAAVVPTLLAGLLSGPRAGRPWPLWISMVLSILAWVAVVSLTLFRPHLGDGSLPRMIGLGVLNSSKAILTSLLPAPARPELLVLVHVTVWLAAFAGAELALRTSLRVAPCLPALAAFGVALALGVGGPGSNTPLVVAAAVLIAALALVRSGPEGSAGGPLGRLTMGVASTAVLGALTVLAASHVPVSGDPYDPREQVQAPPPQQRDSVSPLDRVGGWLLSPDEVLFTVRADRPQNWRLAVLDRFDGVTWTSDAQFVPTGGRVPAAGEDGEHLEVGQQVTIKNLPGTWVPAADRPRDVEGLGVVADPVSGALAAARPLRQGQSYRVVSSVRQWRTDDLASAVPAGDAEARAALELPNGPGAQKAPPQIPEFRTLAQQATRGADGPVQQAAMLSQWLKTYAKYDVTAPPGHNYRQLDFFLGQGRRGTPEHFATAYAVLARTLGLPTRVVVGFRRGRPAAGLLEVRSGDVVVWPEVRFAGLGWVPFFPTPERAGRSRAGDDVAAGETLQQLEQAQRNAASRTRGAGPERAEKAPPKPARAAEEAPRPWWVYAVAAAGALVPAYLVAVLMAPVVRRRRRRRADPPAVRIAGAWQQALEHLADVGLSTVRTLTAHEVARLGGRSVGDDARGHLGSLAELVDRARFADGPPDPGSADQAWRHCDEVDRLVTLRVGRTRRLRRRLHPRSLRRRGHAGTYDSS
ncbi:DUF3488 and transglutaminase-like domain-containing protein [Actinomadura sp. HBU206391]|uniref:DUF3488 and transglutaminase-like domain-containing protein n=1 Tax=Actinomadura sp. HBU206391 TaxID=2731692 RepID=UPI00164EF7B0|nr:DUF3488 and transglutaminase-like domain-containing protein [Actinomadura sp. HBU206391]MBC6459501.1 DUF3488 domain-containing protein [Actinomadura sp. HBU206391]